MELLSVHFLMHVQCFFLYFLPDKIILVHASDACVQGGLSACCNMEPHHRPHQIKSVSA